MPNDGKLAVIWFEYFFLFYIIFSSVSSEIIINCDALRDLVQF